MRKSLFLMGRVHWRILYSWSRKPPVAKKQSALEDTYIEEENKSYFYVN
jgi:hypothetical protein